MDIFELKNTMIDFDMVLFRYNKDRNKIRIDDNKQNVAWGSLSNAYTNGSFVRWLLEYQDSITVKSLNVTFWRTANAKLKQEIEEKVLKIVTNWLGNTQPLPIVICTMIATKFVWLMDFYGSYTIIPSMDSMIVSDGKTEVRLIPSDFYCKVYEQDEKHFADAFTPYFGNKTWTPYFDWKKQELKKHLKWMQNEKKANTNHDIEDVNDDEEEDDDLNQFYDEDKDAMGIVMYR